MAIKIERAGKALRRNIMKTFAVLWVLKWVVTFAIAKVIRDRRRKA